MIETFINAPAGFYESSIEQQFNDMNKHDEIEQQRKALELEQVIKRKAKWQLAYADDAISPEDLRARTEEDRKKEEHLKKQLLGLPKRNQKNGTSKTTRTNSISLFQSEPFSMNQNRSKSSASCSRASPLTQMWSRLSLANKN